MRHSALVLAGLLAVGLTLPAEAQDPKAPTPSAVPDTLKDPQAQLSYAIGMNVGRNLAAGFKRDEITVDPAILAEGLRDALSGAKPQLTDDQARALLIQLQTSVQSRKAAEAAQASADNLAQAAAFLKANGAKAGVVSLPSGLQYEVLTAGTGPTPKPDDVVVCNYRGTLLDGTEFDSSYKRGAPSSFPVNGVIKGWTEALQRMPVGSKWRLYIPANLAYGEKGGAGGQIGPNALLVFEVELISIQRKG
jgi:FKBP-type peptidyl-prolyl cis-trans isomerase FklB